MDFGAGTYALGFTAGVLSILTHADKRFEAFLVEHSAAWLTDLTTRF